MSDNIVGWAAVIMIFGIPMAAMYTFYRVRKLRTDERLAALARGVDVPMQPDLPEGARSRRFGILLTAGGNRLYGDLRADRACRARRLDGSRLRHHSACARFGLLRRFCADPQRSARVAGCELDPVTR